MENKDITKTVYHARGELDKVWSLWERQQSHQYSTDSLTEIVTFKNLKTFAKFWRVARHSNISDFLQLEEDTMVKIKLYLKDEWREIQIDCFMFFRNGIRPEWEDKKNADGGHLLYQIQFPKRTLVDSLWQNLVFGLMGESWANSEHVCGLRVLNKVKAKDIYFKVEIWIDFRESDHSTQYFKTKEEQDNVLTSLKQSFVNAINQSYIDSKEKDDAVVNTIAIGDLKFENHHNEPQQNFAHKKKTGGGGGGPGGYSKGGRGGSRW